MISSRTVTSEEREELDYVNQQSIYRVEIINEFLKVCKINNLELCDHLSISDDSIYRYQRYLRKLRMDVYIKACYFFNRYMKEHNIAYTPRLKELIKLTSLFDE